RRRLAAVSFTHCGYPVSVIGGSATLSFPFSQTERSQALSLRYDLFNLKTHTTRVDPSIDKELAAATLSYLWTDARRFVRGVSAEEGQRLSVSLRTSDPA